MALTPDGLLLAGRTLERKIQFNSCFRQTKNDKMKLQIRILMFFFSILLWEIAYQVKIKNDISKDK